MHHRREALIERERPSPLRPESISDSINYRLLWDHGPSDIAAKLAKNIKANKKSHLRSALFYPQGQAKIERWYQTLPNQILLQNCFLPDYLEVSAKASVAH